MFTIYYLFLPDFLSTKDIMQLHDNFEDTKEIIRSRKSESRKTDNTMA